MLNISSLYLCGYFSIERWKMFQSSVRYSPHAHQPVPIDMMCTSNGEKQQQQQNFKQFKISKHLSTIHSKYLYLHKIKITTRQHSQHLNANNINNSKFLCACVCVLFPKLDE